MTYEQALARAIEKLEDRAERWNSTDIEQDNFTAGVSTGTRWALEDARMLQTLAKEAA